MRISRVELQDIKSYEDAVIEFGPGINAICGENGAGKSSILEAIGFTLFDYSPFRRQADLVRHGSKSGVIAVSFVSDDEREYEVVRKCGTSAGYYVYDPDLGTKLAEGASDVKDWLRRQFGLPADADLAGLFADAIGVPQGNLTAIFAEPDSIRESKFSSLLRTRELEDAWRELRATVRHLEQRINALDVEIAGLEARAETIPQHQAHRAELEERIRVSEETLRAKEAQLNEVSARLAELDEGARAVSRLENQCALLRQKVDSAAREAAEAKERLEEAEEARRTAGEALPGYQAYLSAQEELEALEQRRKERDTLLDALRAVDVALSSSTSRLASLDERIEAVSQAAERAEALRPEAERFQELERELRELDHTTARLEERAKSGERIALTLQEQVEEMAQRQKELEEIEAFAPLAGQVGALQAEIDILRRERAKLEADIERNRQALEMTAGGLCPFLAEPCRNLAEGVSLTEHFAGELERLEPARAELLRKYDALTAELERALQAAHRYREREALAGLLTRLESRCADLRDQLAALEADRQELARLTARRQAVEEELAGRRPIFEEYQRAATLAAQLAALQAARVEADASRRELETQFARVNDQLEPFAGLDQHIEGVRAVQAEHLPAYQTYLRVHTQAERVEECRDILAERERGLQAAQTSLAETEQALEQARAAYDPEEHARTRAAREGLVAETASLKERLANARSDLEQEKAEIEALQREAEALARTRAARRQEESLLDFVEMARALLHQAQPHITKLLVQSISRQAAGFFSQIVDDYSLHLEWDETFAITVEKAGHERTFQQLSGGEQMSAALAVRLALLREISNLDIAFFDEPTANLDEIRRENLAENIISLQGFSQLFVISHDDTFERITENRIRIVKENGVSRVAPA